MPKEGEIVEELAYTGTGRLEKGQEDMERTGGGARAAAAVAQGTMEGDH